MDASALMAKIITRFPLVIDALAVMGKNRGQAFLDDFGLVMTGVESKLEFMKPRHCIPILIALISEFWRQKILRQESVVPDIARPILDGFKKGKGKKGKGKGELTD